MASLRTPGSLQNRPRSPRRFARLSLLAALCAAALTHARAFTTTQTLMLTGTGKDDPVQWNFECTGPAGGQNLNIPTTIGVPSNWELQGFGTYSYGTQSPRSSDVGSYSYTFTVPSTWAGQNVQLVFEGSMTDTTVTLNGTSAGPTHQGGFTQFRYNVSSMLNYGGANTIAATVAQSSSNSTINGAERQGDYWNFGGIYRPVYLECRPPQSIQQVAINALASGSFSALVTLNNPSVGQTLTASIQTLAGQQVGSSFSTTITSAMVASGTATISANATGITTWNPENPYLYQVVFQLQSGSTLLHSYTQRFGFRTVQLIANQGLFINGVKVRLKGICKHTFWPSSGRTSSPAESGSAVAMLQAANINAVRMSHYPPDQHFLNDCDAAGIMVLDELPGWQHAYDTATATRMVSEMVPRDVNHPSIVLWDNGNENGWNTAVDGNFALYDPQGRTVTHPGDNKLFNNIYDEHYPTYTQIQSQLSTTNINLPTEFVHALYDGGGGSGLADYYALMKQTPTSAGGIIWSWDDEGVVRTDEGGIIDTTGNEAPDGIVGPYWQPEPSYYAVRDIFSPVTIPTAPVLSSTFNGQIGVQNDYFFSALNTCTFSWQVVDFPTISGSATGPIVSSSGTLTGPAVAAQASGTLQLNLPAGWSNHAALQLTAYNKNGQLLTTWCWPIQSQAAMESQNLPTPSGTATAVTSGTAIVLTGATTNVAISKTTGLIASVTAAGNTVSLTNGPSIVSGSSTFSSISLQQSGATQVVTANFTGNLQTITYTMRGDGWLKVDYILSITGSQSLIGVTFTYPQGNLQGMRWFGNGPEPVWQNRLQGVSLSVWNKTYTNEVPGYIWANQPVFNGFHSGLRWASIQTSEAAINVIAETPNLYLGVGTPGFGGTPVDAIATIPTGNLSLLEAISPIGSKQYLPSAANIGPSSGTVTGTGAYEGVFYMSFGAATNATPPQITSVDATSPGRVTVNFNTTMGASAFDPSSYNFTPGLNVYAVTPGSGSSVILDVQPLSEGATYTLSVNPSLVSSGNLTLTGSTSFPVSFNGALTLRLPFDTETGGVSPDTSGNGLDATLSQVTLGPGWSGSAALFAGSTTSYATVTLPALNSYTIAAWINVSSTGNSSFPRIASLASDVTEFYLETATGSTPLLGFQAGIRGSWRTAYNLLPAYGTWCHVAVTYDGTNANATPIFYLNGTALGTPSGYTGSGSYATAGTMVIGNRTSDGGRAFAGSIDQFLVYNRVLTPAEIAGLAALPPTQSYSSWSSSYGIPSGNPTLASDGDGIPDLLKYVLSLNPTSFTPSPIQTGIDASNNLEFIYPIANDAQGVTATAQTSTDLIHWSAIPAANISPWRALTDSTLYRATMPQDGFSHFFRLMTSP
jgi:hypothetical protein